MSVQNLPPFQLERFFAQHEFSSRYLLCSSDSQALRLKELLALADEEGLQWWDQLSLGYCEYFGDVRLRQEIASIYGGSVCAEDVCCFVGAQEAVLLMLPLLVAADEHAIVLWPGYQSLLEVVRAQTPQVSLLELNSQDGWAFPWDSLEKLWQPNTRLLVVNFPHNPTGADISAAELERLSHFCRDRGAWLFSDEVYRGPDWSRSGQPCGYASSFSDRAISMGVLSKCYGLAGLRLGWVVCQDPQLRARLGQARDYTTICNPAPSEALGFIGLRARQQLFERYAQLVQNNAQLFAGVVERYSGLLDWVAPKGGTMAFPRWQGSFPAQEFSRLLLAERDTLVLPGDVYGLSGLTAQDYRHHFRMGLGRSNFPEALEQLEDWLGRLA